MHTGAGATVQVRQTVGEIPRQSQNIHFGKRRAPEPVE
jgi:hypothetical protein